MIRRLPFALLLGIRSHFGPRQRVLTLLTLVAIATSVALATGLEMASRSVEAELERTADALAGAAELEISGGSLGVPEDLLERVTPVPGVQAAAPLLEATLHVREGAASGTAIHLLGVDLLADPTVRAYRFNQDQVKERDPLRLILAERSVVITESLARRIGLGLHDPLPLASEAGPIDVTVEAILREGGVADAFGGQLVVMDIYLMQTLLGREGRFDRIDIVLEPGAQPAEVSAALTQKVGGQAEVRRAALRDAWVDNTVAAVRFLIWALVVVGVLVASLLSYATLSLSVDRRTREFALLGATGLEPRRVRRLVRVDALLFSAVGSALGIALGVGLARAFVGVLSAISSFLQDVEIQTLALTPTTLGIGLLVGLGVAVVGSFEPAYRASARAPLEVLRSRQSAVRVTSARRRGWIYPGLALVWLGLALGLIPAPASLRMLGIFALGLLGIGLLARDGFAKFVVWLRGGLERVVPRIGRLAGASLLARPFHTAVTLATVAGVVTGVTVTLVLVRSLSNTLDAWTASLYPDGILVTAGNPVGGRESENIEPGVIETLRATPGVRTVYDQYKATVLYQGEEVLLVGSAMDVMARHGRLPALDVDPSALALAVASGDIAVSDQFAGHFGVGRGDEITLATPRGPRSFRVAGVIRDYAGPAGSLNLDVRVYDELWPRSGAAAAVIWVDGAVEPVLGEIRQRVGGEQALFFVHGEELERYASSVIGQFTVLLDGVSALTGILGGIAIMNLLLGAVLERRREMALLRSIGATGGQIMGLILIDGALLSASAAAAGIGLGLVCAYPMVTGVVRSAFSWWVEFQVAPGELAWLVVLVLGAALVAGLYPAVQGRSVAVREALAPE